MTREACNEIAIATHSEDLVDQFVDKILELQRRADERKLVESNGRSLDSYHYDVGQFCDFIRERDLSLVDGLEAWIAEVKTRCRARTVNRKLSAARARIVELLDEIELPDRVRAKIERSLRAVRGVKVNSNKVHGSKIIDYRTELPRLLEAITDRSVALMVEFLASTGCRIAEACSIELRNCYHEGELVRIVFVGKGSRERESWIPATLWLRIVDRCGSIRFLFEHDWQGSRRPYNTRSMSTRISTWTEKILGRKLSAHAFRHSYATFKLHEEQRDIRTVSRLLGHRSVSTTLDIYDGHVVSSADALVVFAC